jgi:hypothetical protein
MSRMSKAACGPVTNRYISQKSDPWSDKKVARRLAGWADEFAADGLTKFAAATAGRRFFSVGCRVQPVFPAASSNLGYSILRSEWGKRLCQRGTPPRWQTGSLRWARPITSSASVDIGYWSLAKGAREGRHALRAHRPISRDMPFCYRMERSDLPDQPKLP